jgi:hypothetical protein
LVGDRLLRDLQVIEALDGELDVVLLEDVGAAVLGEFARELSSVLDELVSHQGQNLFYLRIHIVLA